MSNSLTESKRNYALSKASKSRHFDSISVPQFEYKLDRWATARSMNVEQVRDEWSSSPYKVRIYTDKKFGHNSMVMLRKDTFETMVNVLRDLSHGEAVIRANLETVFTSIKLIEKLVEATPTQDATPLQLAVKNLTQISGTISSIIEFSGPTKKVVSSDLTSEEMEELRKLEESSR